MPPKGAKLLQDVVREVGVYPAEAYLFVQQGLSLTVQSVHAKQTNPNASRHVGGRHLCNGLRELALKQWGFMAGLVLSRWNITTTMDFGRIVFAMVEHDLLQKTDDDTMDDFRNVFDFRTFENEYKIELPAELDRPKSDARKS